MNGKYYLYALASVIAAIYIATVISHSDIVVLQTRPTWRLLYIFFHGGLLHALSNVMCLVAIARSDFRVPVSFVVMAVAVAICAPMSADAVTLGSSGVCYALLGAMSWQSMFPKRFHVIIGFFVAIGFLPWLHVNYMLHAFCYIEGVMFGWICSE